MSDPINLNETLAGPPVIAAEPETMPDYARTGVNLASASLGAKIVAVTDDFFAAAPRMLADGPAIFYPGRFDGHGKYMDGWESRRRRGMGNDHCALKLAAPGRILGFDVDTSHFTGNYPPACRIEVADVDGDPKESDWIEVLPVRALGASNHHFFSCHSSEIWTHVRVHMLPDGGIARLRVYGRPVMQTRKDGEVELSSAMNGGRVIGYSDAHYGEVWRVLAPGRGINMGDGWETRRRREPGADWMVIGLATRGEIKRCIVDTHHFKGNYPDMVSLQGADMSQFRIGSVAEADQALITSSMFWEELLPPQKLEAHAIHDLSEHLLARGPLTHVRLNIHPDGGISRLRLFGDPA